MKEHEGFVLMSSKQKTDQKTDDNTVTFVSGNATELLLHQTKKILATIPMLRK